MSLNDGDHRTQSIGILVQRELNFRWSGFDTLDHPRASGTSDLDQAVWPKEFEDVWMKKLSIAVIGAGIGGLTAAAALRRAGIDVTVFEQAAHFSRLGAGIQIGCNAMKVLRRLGLEPMLRAAAFYPRSWNNRKHDTCEIRFDMIFGESAEERWRAPYLLAHRGDLHAALASTVPEADLRLGHKLTALEQLAGGGVQLTFANGAVIEADGVVAADGVHSLVKEYLFGVDRPNFTGRIAYRTVFPAALIGNCAIDDCTKWWGPDRHIVIYYV